MSGLDPRFTANLSDVQQLGIVEIGKRCSVRDCHGVPVQVIPVRKPDSIGAYWFCAEHEEDVYADEKSPIIPSVELLANISGPGVTGAHRPECPRSLAPRPRQGRVPPGRRRNGIDQIVCRTRAGCRRSIVLAGVEEGDAGGALSTTPSSENFAIRELGRAGERVGR